MPVQVELLVQALVELLDLDLEGLGLERPRIRTSRRSMLTGLVRKSTAPRFIASTAVSMLP